MIYEKINLISEILDATLNLKCIYIEYLSNNLDDLKKLIPPIFTINDNEYNRFLNSILGTKENHVYWIEDFMFGNYVIICLDENTKNYLFIGPYLLTNNQEHLLKDFKEYNISDSELDLIKLDFFILLLKIYLKLLSSPYRLFFITEIIDVILLLQINGIEI